MSEELLYNELYERTKNFGRNEFIKELMRLERENQQLKEQLQQCEEVIEETINKIETLRMEKWSITGMDIMDLLDILNKYKKEESK